MLLTPLLSPAAPTGREPEGAAPAEPCPAGSAGAAPSRRVPFAGLVVSKPRLPETASAVDQAVRGPLVFYLRGGAGSRLKPRSAKGIRMSTGAPRPPFYLGIDLGGTNIKAGVVDDEGRLVPDGATVETLFVPVSAPWLKISESIEFVRAVGPRRAYALHDSLLSDNGLTLTDALMTARSGAEYARLAPGATVDA